MAGARSLVSWAADLTAERPAAAGAHAEFERLVRGTTMAEVIHRVRTKHYRNLLRRAGYFNAGARRRRLKFSVAAHRELGDRLPHRYSPPEQEYRANLMKYLYGWFELTPPDRP